MYERPETQLDTGLRYATVCPQGNCKDTITSVDMSELDSVCVYSKTGVLCGQCQANLSVVFGITDCKRCSNTNCIRYLWCSYSDSFTYTTSHNSCRTTSWYYPDM